jgi:hypothetical protein
METFLPKKDEDLSTGPDAASTWEKGREDG